jgi:hypothetical protein
MGVCKTNYFLRVLRIDSGDNDNHHFHGRDVSGGHEGNRGAQGDGRDGHRGNGHSKVCSFNSQNHGLEISSPGSAMSLVLALATIIPT